MYAISVDDVKTNLLIIEAMSREIELDVVSFLDPLEALQYIKRNSIDLVFVDYEMPKINGINLILQIRKVHPDIPIIMITGVKGDEELKLNALKAGATEFLNKPLNSSEFKTRVTNLLQLRKSQLLLKDKALLLQDEVNNATADIAQREHETLTVLGKAAEFKDPETSNHITRVSYYSKILSMLNGSSIKNQNLIFHATPLHDIGKIGTPDSILLKPGKLTQEEWEIMKKHTINGYEMLLNVKSPYLQAGAVIAKSHHEKFNGKGYPEALRGREIPLMGRIVAIADVFDALTSKRPYKEPWPFEDAINELIKEKGEHFDPDLVDLFVSNQYLVKKIYLKYQD